MLDYTMFFVFFGIITTSMTTYREEVKLRRLLSTAKLVFTSKPRRAGFTVREVSITSDVEHTHRKCSKI